MRWTDLRTGFACNHACRFCDQADLRAAGGEADTTTLKATIDRLPHREALLLAGGEVTLRNDVLEIVAHARRAGFQRVALQSNGSVLASAGAAPALRAAGLTDVALALHGPTPAVHDWLTGVPGSFKRVVAAARRCVAAGLGLRVNTVVTRTGAPVLAETIGLAAALGARSIRVHVGREEGAAANDARMLLPRWELVAEAVRAAAERARVGGVELEVLGLPPCVAPDLLALLGDRRDSVAPDRAAALAAPPPSARIWPAPCASCTLHAICPGVDAAYVRRWGTEELRPQGPQPPAPEEALLVVGAGDNSRTLRQRLVKLHGAGARSVRFVGRPIDEELPGLLRECERLGLGVHTTP
jgi:MoaA/NifB/PqqE/SkfB family radical SAM enzyme